MHALVPKAGIAAISPAQHLDCASLLPIPNLLSAPRSMPCSHVPSCCPDRLAMMGPDRAGSAAAAQVGATTTPVTRCVLAVKLCTASTSTPLRTRTRRTKTQRVAGAITGTAVMRTHPPPAALARADKRKHGHRAHTHTPSCCPVWALPSGARAHACPETPKPAPYTQTPKP